jgi:hypothetical protein
MMLIPRTSLKTTRTIGKGGKLLLNLINLFKGKAAMFINYLLDLRKCLTPSNIEPRGGATKTGFRPVSAGFDGVLRSGMTLIAAERTGPRWDRLQMHPPMSMRSSGAGRR